MKLKTRYKARFLQEETLCAQASIVWKIKESRVPWSLKYSMTQSKWDKAFRKLQERGYLMEF